jgi:hypothetical protein
MRKLFIYLEDKKKLPRYLVDIRENYLDNKHTRVKLTRYQAGMKKIT